MGNQCAGDRQIDPVLAFQKPSSIFGSKQAPSPFASAHNELTYLPGTHSRYGDLVLKKQDAQSVEFLLQTHTPSGTDRLLSISQKLTSNLGDVSNIKLNFAMTDENNPNTILYTGSRNNIASAFNIRGFTKFQEPAFKPLLYQYNMNQEVSALGSPFLHNMVDSFILSTSPVDEGPNTVPTDKCHITVYEDVAANLSDIASYRKNNNWPWTEQQFNLVVTHMLQALDALHSKNITHNDIRPANIFYSLGRRGYVLGNFGHAFKHQSRPASYNDLQGIHYFASPEAKTLLLEPGKTFDPYANDIYCLGLSLLSVFFMSTPLSPEGLINAGHSNESKFPNVLSRINDMLLPETNRPTIKQILDGMQGIVLPTNREDTLIESLRYKNRGDPEQQHMLLEKAYSSMLMGQESQTQNNELLHYYELNNNRLQEANMSYKLATSPHATPQESQAKFSNAAKIYSSIAHDLMEEHRLDESVLYYNKAIESSRHVQDGDYNTALLLRDLARVHAEKSEYEISKSFLAESLNITKRVKGANSIELAQMLVDMTKTECEFQDYEVAEGHLKNATKIVELRENDADPRTKGVRADILEKLANVMRLKAMESSDRQAEYRMKAEECLKQAKRQIEKLPNNDLKMASANEVTGHLYFDQRQYQAAKKAYETSLLLRKNINKSSVEIGQNLTYIANCNKSLKEYDSAVRNYNEAMQIFRKEIGNDHNQYTAVALGNLGIVYNQQGDTAKAKEYLKVAKGILKDLYGEDSPDYAYFDSIIKS